MLGPIDAQSDIELSRRRPTALRGCRCDHSGHELSSDKSATCHCGFLEQLSPRNVVACHRLAS
jgi:hypothetical protein